MVSALWKACAAEAQDLEGAQQLLAEPGVDLEIKDHTGTTPLIQAVRNGHKDIVKALLSAGADPNNSSSRGRPDTYTSDPEMLALLQPKHQPPQQSYEGFSPSHDPNAPYDPTMQPYYYPGPPGHEGPYQPYAYPMLSPPEGQPPMSGFMPSGDSNSPGGVPNLPPADIARTIPCRYFPVCRYGSSCMFLHPQPPYFSGPPPPAHPHYPPMYPPQGYYMMRPGAYPAPGAPPVEPVASPVANTQPFPPPAPLSYPPPPNGVPPFSPATNGAPFSPPVNGAPFPNGAPYPPPTNGAPYPPPNGAPYTPISTGTPYTPATNGTPSPYGPPPFSPGSATPFSAGAPFTPGPVPAPYPYPRAYPDAPKDAPVNGNVNVNGNGEEHQQPPAANGMNGTGNHVNGGFPRRGGRGGRRESFGQGRQSKPACLFFPSGRCRNGDDCRFPHVLPEPGSQPAFRYPPNGHNHNNNGAGRYGHRPRPSMGHHDGPPPAHIPPGTKLPFAPNGHVPHTGPPVNQLNGSPNQQQQRVPNADDFPVLRSAASAPDTPNGLERASALNGSGGLTAAQVLQAPPPAKKGKADAESVGELADALSKVHMNGLAASAFDATPATPEIAAVGA